MLIFISCHCKFVQYNGLFFQVVFANTSIELSTTNLYRMAHIMFPPTPEVSFISNFDSMFLFIINDRISKYSIILIFTSFFPPMQTLSKICQQGFDDARLFLQQNNLVGCNQCISSVKSTSANVSEYSTDADCLECETQKRVSFKTKISRLKHRKSRITVNLNA